MVCVDKDADKIAALRRGEIPAVPGVQPLLHPDRPPLALVALDGEALKFARHLVQDGDRLVVRAALSQPPCLLNEAEPPTFTLFRWRRGDRLLEKLEREADVAP